LRQPSAAPTPRGLSLFPDTVRQPEDEALRQARRLSLQTPPDQAARVRRLQAATGLPRELIMSRIDEVESALEMENFDAAKYRLAAPVTTAWLNANPDNMSVASDDLTQLRTIEAYFTSLQRGASRGHLMGGEYTQLGQKQRRQAGYLSAGEELRLTNLERQIARQPDGRNFLQDVLYHGGEFAGQMVHIAPDVATGYMAGASVGAAIGLLGGPISIATVPITSQVGGAVGTAFGAAKGTFRLEAALAYRELKQVTDDNGFVLPESIARNAARAIGTLNASLEVLSLTVVAAPFVQMGQRFLRSATRDALTSATVRRALMRMGVYYAKAAGAESVTEIAQELNNVVIGDLMKATSQGDFQTVFNSPAAREAMVERLAETAEATAQGMLLIGLPGASVTLAHNVSLARQAQRRVDFFTALGEDMAESKSFQRLPEGLQELVKQKTQGTAIEDVYVDTQPLIEYFQAQKINPFEVMAQVLEDPAEFQAAIDQGLPVRIPMHIYATKLAPTEHNAFLVEEIRLGGPDVMNARIAKEALEEAESLAQDIPDEELVEEAEFEQQTNLITEQLVATGMSPENARVQAQQQAAFYMTLQQRTGIDPRTLYEVSIGSPTAAQDVVTETARTLAQEQGAIPTFEPSDPRAWPSPRHKEALREYVLRLEQEADQPATQKMFQWVKEVADAVEQADHPAAVAAWAKVPANLQRWIREASQASGVWRWVERGDAMTFWQRTRSAPTAFLPGFYSKAEALVNKEMGGRASRQQLERLFEKTKAEEREWLGIANFLSTQETFTKDEVLAHLYANRLYIKHIHPEAGRDEHQTALYLYDAEQRIREELAVEYENKYISEHEGEDEDGNEQLEPHNYYKVSRLGREHPEKTFPTYRDAQEYVMDFVENDPDLADRVSDQAHEEVEPPDHVSYEDYTLPGGTNYQESVFTLPNNDNVFEDGHFSERVDGNDFAHARTKDRLVQVSPSESLSVLFVEEIQSDWHQQGRDRGYEQPGDAKKLELMQRIEHFRSSERDQAVHMTALRLAGWDFDWSEAEGEQWLNLFADKVSVAGNFADALQRDRDNPRLRRWWDQFDSMPKELQDRVEETVSTILAYRALVAERTRISRLLPNAPFKKTWHEFVFKAMLREAVQLGKDAIGWTTGGQQNARYSKSLRGNRFIYTQDGRLTSYSGVESFVSTGENNVGWSRGRLGIEEDFGKEFADKLFADAPADYFKLDMDVIRPDLTLNLPESIEIGGSGMRGFYDKILVDYANKLGKKYSVKVESLPVNTSTSTLEHPDLTEQVHVLRIPKEMQAAIMEQGFELYQRRKPPINVPIRTIGPTRLIEGFFSKAEVLTQKEMGGKASREQLKAMFDKIKTDEREWLSIPSLLESQEVFTKAEVMDHLRQHRPRMDWVEELEPDQERGDEETAVEIVQEEAFDKFLKINPARTVFTVAKMGPGFPARTFARPDDAYKYIEDAIDVLPEFQERIQSEMGPSNFEEHTLEGSRKTYREVGITLPDLPNDFFAEGHFVDHNLMVHARVTERTVRGTEVLLIEELQSDWHQQGREQGYETGEPTSPEEKVKRQALLRERRKLEVQIAAINKEQNKLYKELFKRKVLLKTIQERSYHATVQVDNYEQLIIDTGSNGFNLKRTTGWASLSKEMKDRVQEGIEREKVVRPLGDRIYKINRILEEHRRVSSVPNAPFKKTWHELMFKALLTRAVQQNKEVLAWTTGTQQEERWGERGLKTFYDTILTGYANKLGKRYGVQVEKLHVGRYSVHSLKLTPELKTAIAGEGLELFQPEQEGAAETPRGKISFKGQAVNIQLLEQANFSTFLHESGHLYLSMLTKLVHEGGTSGQVANDLRRLQRAIGAEPGATDYTEEQHEHMARLTEAYFRQGRAPSARLKAAFFRFRTWLHALYRSLTELGVTLTPEVSDVFDRMFATDQEIAAQQQEAEATPIFTTAADAGMTDAEFAVYKKSIEKGHQRAVEQLQTKLMRDAEKQFKAEYREAKQEIMAEVTAEINALSGYRALMALQLGLQSDGTPLETPIKLDRAAIVAERGEDFLSELPSPRVHADEGGVSLQEATELLGFTSPDALLIAISTLPPRKAAIRDEVQKRLKDKFGDLLTDGRLPEAGKAAVLNAHREDIIQAELRALRSKQRQVEKAVKQKEKVLTKAAKKEADVNKRWADAEQKMAVAVERGAKQAEIDALQEALQSLETEKEKALKDAQREREYERRFLDAEAKRAEAEGGALVAGTLDGSVGRREAREQARIRISHLKIMDIKPHRYWTAARKASQAAIVATAKKDYVTAANAKQAELLAVALYREATRVKEKAELVRRRTQRLQSKGVQERLGKSGQEYREQINAMLERFSFAPISNKAVKRRASLAAFVKSQTEKHLPVNIPEELLADAFVTPWKDMTIDELTMVDETLQHIDHLSKLKIRMLRRDTAKSFAQARDEITARIKEKATQTIAPELETRRPSDAVKRMIKGFFAAHRKYAHIVREMDGWEDGGPLWELLVRPLNAMTDEKTTLTIDMTEKLFNIFHSAFPDTSMSGMHKRVAMPSLDNMPLSRQGKLMMALNWGTLDNREKLLSGLSLSLKRPVSENDVWAVLDTLTAPDWDFVEQVWAYADSHWKPMKALAERLDGVAPEKLAAAPVNTRFGTKTGGYMHIKYDDRQSTRVRQNVLDRQASKTLRAGTTRASTKAGSRNERVTDVQLPLRLDFGVLFEHLEEVALDLTHTEGLIDLNRLLRSDEVEDAIRSHYGEAKYTALLDALRDVAAGEVPAHNWFDHSLNWVRRGSSLAALAWNMGTAVLQPLGLFNSIVRLGGPIKGTYWIAKGIKRWLSDATTMEDGAAWVQEVSSFMKHRHRTFMREIDEIRNRVGVASNNIHVYVSFGIEKVTLEKMNLQDLQDSFFWIIAKMQVVADMPTWLGAYEKAMADNSDEARAIALADQVVIDSQSTGQLKDLAAVQRGNPALKLWANFYTFFSAAWQLHVEAVKKTDFKSPVSMGRLAGDLLLLSVIPAIMGKLMRDALRGDEEEDDLAKALAAEVASYLANMLVGVRELTGVLNGFYGYGGPAGGRIFNEAGKLIQQVQQGVVDLALWKALNQAGGILLHYPAAQIQRSVLGFHSFMEGEASPLALLFGPPRN
jgi:hypothetical protein